MAHPKEKRQKLEETKEEHNIRLKCHRFRYVQKLVKAIFTIEHNGMKVNYTTEAKCF